MVTIRRKPDFKKNSYEHDAWQKNTLICGVDEVGRGCLAGPVVAAAAIIHTRKKSTLIKDSKEMTPDERLAALEWIHKNAWSAVAVVNHRMIDRVNIYHATMHAMRKAVAHLMIKTSLNPSIILVDAMPLNLTHFAGNVIAFPFGESKSISIAAASIVAKVTRDLIMQRHAVNFPGYKFDSNKGYCTPSHRTLLGERNRSIIHRISFTDHFENVTVEVTTNPTSTILEPEHNNQLDSSHTTQLSFFNTSGSTGRGFDEKETP